jgi:hypothetical protein
MKWISPGAALLLIVLFLAAWTPRLLSLDRFVTADERRWLARSANFYLALTQGDFAQTFQREHPGVTIMWLGTAGFLQRFPGYPQEAPGQFSWEREDFEDWLRTETTYTPLELLAAGRWWISLAISLAIVAGYFPLRRLTSTTTAAAITLAVAWDPFLLALSRQLHPDGLVTVLITLALLLFLAWLYGGRHGRYLIASGIVMGLAWLTKTPAIFLALAGAVLMAFELAWSNVKRQSSPGHLVTALILWGAIATMTFVLLWPAMWVNPVGALLGMVAEMGQYVEGHVNPNFFLGQPTFDPGPLFYPIAYWLRTTPATVLGLLAALVLAWRQRWPFDSPSVRRSTGALALFAFLFGAAMSFGAKQFDRYLLPAFPALDIIAALGWLAALRFLIFDFGVWRATRYHEKPITPSPHHVVGAKRHHLITPSPSHLVTLSAVAVIFLLHALPGFLHYPYYLTYYNPLAGGLKQASETLIVGWGEGLDQAARWLNQQPDAEHLRVAAWYGDGPLSYFLDSQEPISSLWSQEFWFDSDYVVFYLSQWQRLIPSKEAVDFFAGQTPVYIVKFRNQELARIYDVRGAAPPEFTGLYTESATDINGVVRLAAYTIGQHTYLTGDQFTVRLYLKRLVPLDRVIQVQVQLLAQDGSAVGSASTIVVAPDAWLPSKVYAADHALSVPTGTPSGEYQLALTLLDDAGYLLVKDHRIALLAIQAAEEFDIEAEWATVRLTELQHEPAMEPGETLFVDMLADGQVDGSLDLSARLVAPSGVTLAQTDKVLTAHTRFDLTLPPDAPSGEYAIVGVVYDSDTLEPLPDHKGNFTTTLSYVLVQARKGSDS